MAREIAGSLGLYSLKGTVRKACKHCNEHKAHSHSQCHKGIAFPLKEKVTDSKQEHG